MSEINFNCCIMNLVVPLDLYIFLFIISVLSLEKQNILFDICVIDIYI